MLRLLMTCDKCGKEITGPYKSVKDCPKMLSLTIPAVLKKDEGNAMEICADCWNLFMSLKEVPVYTGKMKE